MTDAAWTALAGPRAAALLARSRLARRASNVAVVVATAAVVVTQLVATPLVASVVVTLPAVAYVAGTTWSLTSESRAVQAAGRHVGVTPYAARVLSLRTAGAFASTLAQARALTAAADPDAAAHLAPAPAAMRLARVLALVDALGLAGAIVGATVAFQHRHPTFAAPTDRYAMVGLLFVTLALATASACAAVGAHGLTTGLGRLLAPLPLAAAAALGLALQAGAAVEGRAAPLGWVAVAALAAPAALVALPGSRRWYDDARRAAGWFGRARGRSADRDEAAPPRSVGSAS